MKPILLLSLSMLHYAIADCQNVGIGATSPKARLHVTDSNVVFTGLAALPANAGITPVSGAGTRFMWFANKAALRAGRVSGNDWDAANIGQHSVAFGYNTRAAGIYGFSTGNNTSASGEAAAAFNYNTGATGENATAFGQETDAQAMGSFVIGRYNVAAGSTNTWVETDPLFVVGNGYTYENPPGILNIQRRNAFEILKNGNVNINGVTNFNNHIKLVDSVNIGPASQPLTMSGDVGILNNLFFKPTYITYNVATIIANLNFNSGTYFIISTTVASPSDPPNPLWIRPADGTRIGQIAIVQVAANSAKQFILYDNADYNLDLGIHDGDSTFGFLPGDVIGLIWDGTIWREIFYSKNSV